MVDLSEAMTPAMVVEKLHQRASRFQNALCESVPDESEPAE